MLAAAGDVITLPRRLPGTLLGLLADIAIQASANADELAMFSCVDKPA